MIDDRVTIVQGGMPDLDAVMTVMENSFEPAYGEAWTGAQCASLLPMPGVWLSLACEGSTVIGFALGRVVVNEAELLLLAVHKDRRGRGAGKMLLDRFIEISRSRGADHVHLEMRDGNPAERLYKAAGFTVIGRRKNYYTGRDGQIYDALTLAKS